MKKRFFALVAVFALLLSTLMLTSCPKGGLNLDESYEEGKGSGDVYIVSDPTDPEAGASVEDQYIGDHNE